MRSHMSNSEQHQTPGRHKLKLVKAFHVSFLLFVKGVANTTITGDIIHIFNYLFNFTSLVLLCAFFLTFYSLFVCWKGKSFTIDVQKFNGIGSRSSISSGGSRI